MDSNVATVFLVPIAIWLQSREAKKKRITSLLQLENYRAFAVNFLCFSFSFFMWQNSYKLAWTRLNFFEFETPHTLQIGYAMPRKLFKLKSFSTNFYPQFVFSFFFFIFFFFFCVLFGFWNIAIWPEWSWAGCSHTKVPIWNGTPNCTLSHLFFSVHRLWAFNRTAFGSDFHLSSWCEYANLNRLPSNPNPMLENCTPQSKKYNFLPSN